MTHLTVTNLRPSRQWRRVAATAIAACSLVLAACGEGDVGQVASNAEADRRLPAVEKPTAPPLPTIPAAGIELRDTTLAAAVAADGLTQPTSVAFVGNRMLVTEKGTGKVKLVTAPGSAVDVVDLAVNSFDERGLLGITVHPDFEDKPYVYLHWTWRGDGEGQDKLLGPDSDQAADVPALGNRVDRFRWAANRLTFDRNIVRFPSNTLNPDTMGRTRGNHDAGPLAFGPDKKLYVQIGDQNMRGQLQNIKDGPAPDDANFTGVILRLNDDGTTPSDNPLRDAAAELDGEVAANVAKIYVYGVRNSFGLAFEPESGALWQTENGDDSYDEINVFPAGANSGWIQVQGRRSQFADYKRLEVESADGLDNPSYPPSQLEADFGEAREEMLHLEGSAFVQPVLTYVYPPALTAVGFVGDNRLGARSERTAWVGTVLTNALIRYPLAEDGRRLQLRGALADQVDNNTKKGDLGESDQYVVGTGFGIITDIEQGPDGALYVSSIDGGKVYRLAKAAVATSGGTAGRTTTTAVAAPVGASVTVRDDEFVAPEVQVPAGQAVAWRWTGKNPHNVAGPGFKSKIQATGTFTRTFPEAGTFDYRCEVHPGMTGKVIVS